jgi:hypothetical protein
MTVYLGNTRGCLGNTQALAAYPKFLIIYSHSPQPAECHGTRGSTRALPHGEARSGAVGRVAVPEPSRMVGGGCRIRSRGTRSSTGALPSWEAGSGTVGHAAAPEPSRARRRGLELQNTWQHRSPSCAGRRDPELRATWRYANACPALSWLRARMRGTDNILLALISPASLLRPHVVTCHIWAIQDTWVLFFSKTRESYVSLY